MPADTTQHAKNRAGTLECARSAVNAEDFGPACVLNHEAPKIRGAGL